MQHQTNKFIYWTPRVLSILFICFLTLFSFDVIEPDRTIGQIVIGLFMHNIPVFILIAILVAAWKREIVGAVAFFAAGLLYIISVIARMSGTGFEWYYLAWIAQIAGIAFFIGALFLANWIKKRNNN
jgi:hypothetical protein